LTFSSLISLLIWSCSALYFAWSGLVKVECFSAEPVAAEVPFEAAAAAGALLAGASLAAALLGFWEEVGGGMMRVYICDWIKKAMDK
jgi:hypothetical protein